MPDEAKNTDGTGTATGTQPPGGKTATGAGVDTTSAVPYERFEGVVAERNRLKEQHAALEAKHQEILEQHKSEDQKRIDAAAKAIVDAEWKPKAERWAATETWLKTEVETLMIKIPETHRGAVDSTAPIEVQFRQAKAIAELAGGKASTAIAGGANPAGNGQPKRVTRQAYDQWRQLAGSSDSKDRARFYEQQDEMVAARREGRID